jgi:hypothetical protein
MGHALKANQPFKTMGVYTVTYNEEDLEPMSEIGSREITTWRGVKNKSLKGRHVTDGTLLFDKKHVSGEELYEKLIDRKSDQDVENSEIKDLIQTLRDEDQEEVEILGQMKATLLAMEVKAKRIVIVTNGSDCYAFDATSVDMAFQLIGDSATPKIGDSGVLTFWRYGVPAAAVAGWNFFEVKCDEN